MYEPRFYQEWYNQKLKSYKICYQDTDLLIRTEKIDREYYYKLIKKLRLKLDEYIDSNPKFLSSLTPLKIRDEDPVIIRTMKKYALEVGIGPMAGIAGLFAEKVGKSILNRYKTNKVIVENGGDIFLANDEECITGIYAGKESSFSGKIGLKIKPKNTPLGICTSSATVGPSLSMGKADAVVVTADSTILADIMATALGNKIQDGKNINKAIKYGKNIKGIRGIIIIKEDNIGIWGDVEIVKIDNKKL